MSRFQVTWCEKTVLVIVVALMLLVGRPFFTMTYMQTYGLTLAKDVLILWLFLRCVDLIFLLPDRRAAKRHLDNIEKKWSKF
jgi:hypothetical protein